MFKKSFILFLSYSLFLSSVSPVIAKRKKKGNRRSAIFKSGRGAEYKASNLKVNNVVETMEDNAPTTVPAAVSGETKSVQATTEMTIKPDTETVNKIDTLNAKTMSLQGGQKEIMKRQGKMSEQLEAVNKQAVAATEAANLVLKNAENQKKKEFAKKAKEIGETVASLNSKIETAKSVCSGISSSLNTIYGLDAATTATSTMGTLTAGSATAVGFMKNSDKIVKGDDDDRTKKEKSMEKARTGLMAVSIATSGTSLGTSAAASVNAGKLAEKMKQCNTVVGEIRTINGKLKALIKDFKEEVGSDSSHNSELVAIGIAETVSKEVASNISNKCKGFDIAGINMIKNSMTATAVISGIGTGTAIAGTTTSAIINSGKIDRDSNKHRKLDLTSNIMAGITAGTSLSSTAVSGAVIGKVKAAIEVAKECESAL